MKAFSFLLTLVVMFILAAIPAFASTLTFPNNICSANTDGSGPMVACANYGYINQSYGDTAQLDLQYIDHTIPGDSLRWWGPGYNNLPSAAWGGYGDCAGCSDVSVVLVPAPGYSVTLDSFDMGAWPYNVLNTHIIVTEVGTSNVLNYGLQIIGIGNLAVHFAPGITSSRGFDIRWYDSAYNVGIDNIEFTVSQSTLPEPASMLLLGIGVTGIGLASARRKK